MGRSAWASPRLVAGMGMTFAILPVVGVPPPCQHWESVHGTRLEKSQPRYWLELSHMALLGSKGVW